MRDERLARVFRAQPGRIPYNPSRRDRICGTVEDKTMEMMSNKRKQDIRLASLRRFNVPYPVYCVIRDGQSRRSWCDSVCDPGRDP